MDAEHFCFKEKLRSRHLHNAFSSGPAGGMSALHNNEPWNGESIVNPGCPFRPYEWPNGKEPCTEQAANPKPIKVSPFPLLTPGDAAHKDTLLFHFSLFSLGFALEFFHVFPVQALALGFGSFSDKVVTHYDSNMRNFSRTCSESQCDQFAGHRMLHISPSFPVWCFSALPGGLAAVIYTDALQTFIMLIGAVTLMVFSECFPGGCC